MLEKECVFFTTINPIKNLKRIFYCHLFFMHGCRGEYAATINVCARKCLSRNKFESAVLNVIVFFFGLWFPSLVKSNFHKNQIIYEANKKKKEVERMDVYNSYITIYFFFFLLKWASSEVIVLGIIVQSESKVLKILKIIRCTHYTHSINNKYTIIVVVVEYLVLIFKYFINLKQLMLRIFWFPLT